MVSTKYNRFIFILLTLFAVVFQACEDPISIDLKEGESQLVVDGFIKFYLDSEALNSGIEKQVIRLTKSTGYLNNTPAPAAIGAIVQVTDALNRTFEFKDVNNNGNYVYEGPFQLSFTNPPLGFPGNIYSLNIKYDGEEYISVAHMDSVPKIDSVEFEKQDQIIFGGDTVEEGYTVKAIYTKNNTSGEYEPTRDLPGEGNGYWFKSYRNNEYFSKPREINLAYDAAFSPGSDGVAFIKPIMFNLSPDRLDINDTLRVECWSIGLPNLYFINKVQTQITNGGLFATPPANVPTNIFNKNKDSKVKALGWFGAASVSRVNEIVIE